MLRGHEHYSISVRSDRTDHSVFLGYRKLARTCIAAGNMSVRGANRPVEKPRRSTSFEEVRQGWEGLAEEVREGRRVGEEIENVGVGSLRCQGAQVTK